MTHEYAMPGRAQRTPVAGHSAAQPAPLRIHQLAGNRAFGRLQAKLTVNKPGDAYEIEADRVADQVMRMPEPQVQRTCACGGTCDDCHEEEAALGEAPAGVRAVLHSRGEPLDSATRASMESRFANDFRAVRIHRDAEAVASARAIDARAYAVGNHVVFGEQEYHPQTREGQRLLAHELTHVVQQGASTALHGTVQRQLFPPIPIVVNPPRLPPSPVVVNAVDARQEPATEWYKPWRYTGPITSFFRGDITMTDISSMVTNVQTFLGTRVMHRLNVMDHGNEHGVEIGDDWLGTAADVTAQGSTLSGLKSKFAGSGIVHMQNCHAGQNQDVICALAKAFGVPVYAGTGLHNPLLGFNFGDYVRCDAGGTFNPDAGRPATPTPPSVRPETEMA